MVSFPPISPPILPPTQVEKVREMDIIKKNARSNVYPLRITDFWTDTTYTHLSTEQQRGEKMGYIHILEPTS